MGWVNTRNMVDDATSGQHHVTSFRKSPSAVTTIGVWNDLSMAPGNPGPNYYATSQYEAATLNGSKGLFVGVSGNAGTRHLCRTLMFGTAATAFPMRTMLLDYLLYYPLIDTSTVDEQLMVNDVVLPRYTTGDGVQIMPVITHSPAAPTGLTFQVSYTNQDGTVGRIATGSFGSGTVLGTIACTDRTKTVAGSHTSPFLRLQDGDSGVRSIESFNMISGTDVGLFALVLVKPITQFTMIEQTAPVEVCYLSDNPSLPVIKDGAYLNFVVCPSGSLAATSLHGMIETTWSDN